jgi:hypothetical protein
METLKDNLVVAKHLLDEYGDLAAVDKFRYILAKAQDQQQNAYLSWKLAFELHACMSSTNKPDRKGNHSWTESLESQRRETRNYNDPIPISSTSRDKGK